MTKLTSIEGIGEAYSQTFGKIGIFTTEELVLRGATDESRRLLSSATGFSPKLILDWVIQADLFRIDGVGGEYAELLMIAGVNSIPSLSKQKPNQLFGLLNKINEERKLVRKLPSVNQLSNWVAEAKLLPKIVNHERKKYVRVANYSEEENIAYNVMSRNSKAVPALFFVGIVIAVILGLFTNWFYAGVSIFGYSVGLILGLSKTSVTNTLIKVFLGFSGGIITALAFTLSKSIIELNFIGLIMVMFFSLFTLGSLLGGYVRVTTGYHFAA